jgi:ribonuclease T2
VHGLWPDHCDGTYDQFCDVSRQYTNITAILQSFGKTDLLAYMNTYWKDYQGNDESFWEHEWGKHGTCISTLNTNCYTTYQPQQEVVDFFQTTVDLFKGLDSYAFLAAAGIIPSTTLTYTRAQIYSALSAAYGFEPAIECSSGALDEIYYYYNVLGSIQTGEFVKTFPDDNSTSCPATGIKYLPKYQATTTTTGIATSTSTTTGTPTPTTPYSGKGYLNAYTSSALTGCLISAGAWYTSGTCATYTSSFIDATNTTFTLKSSKGACGITNNIFTCSGTAPSSLFTVLDSYLAYSSSNIFYAAAVPVGTVQQPVYSTINKTTVQFLWQGI